MAVTAGIKVAGLRDLRRALRDVDPEGGAAGEFRDLLRGAAEIVADRARDLAPRSARPRGRHMADTIRPRVSGARAMVVVLAKRRSRKHPAGYPYPNRVEYGRGGRAFLRPALERTRDQVIAHIDQGLADIHRRWN